MRLLLFLFIAIGALCVSAERIGLRRFSPGRSRIKVAVAKEMHVEETEPEIEAKLPVPSRSRQRNSLRPRQFSARLAGRGAEKEVTAALTDPTTTKPPSRNHRRRPQFYRILTTTIKPPTTASKVEEGMPKEDIPIESMPKVDMDVKEETTTARKSKMVSIPIIRGRLLPIRISRKGSRGRSPQEKIKEEETMLEPSEPIIEPLEQAIDSLAKVEASRSRHRFTNRSGSVGRRLRQPRIKAPVLQKTDKILVSEEPEKVAIAEVIVASTVNEKTPIVQTEIRHICLQTHEGMHATKTENTKTNEPKQDTFDSIVNSLLLDEDSLDDTIVKTMSLATEGIPIPEIDKKYQPFLEATIEQLPPLQSASVVKIPQPPTHGTAFRISLEASTKSSRPSHMAANTGPSEDVTDRALSGGITDITILEGVTISDPSEGAVSEVPSESITDKVASENITERVASEDIIERASVQCATGRAPSEYIRESVSEVSPTGNLMISTHNAPSKSIKNKIPIEITSKLIPLGSSTKGPSKLTTVRAHEETTRHSIDKNSIDDIVLTKNIPDVVSSAPGHVEFNLKTVFFDMTHAGAATKKEPLEMTTKNAPEVTSTVALTTQSVPFKTINSEVATDSAPSGNYSEYDYSYVDYTDYPQYYTDIVEEETLQDEIPETIIEPVPNVVPATVYKTVEEIRVYNTGLIGTVENTPKHEVKEILSGLGSRRRGLSMT